MAETTGASTEEREKLKTSGDYEKLQARLLRGEHKAFAPSVDLSTFTADGFKNTPVYDVVNTASTNERFEVWKGKEGTFAEKKTTWAKDVVGYFDRQKQGNSYDTDKKGELEFLVRLGKAANIALDPRKVTTETALAIYNHYFTGDIKESAMDKYIGDIIKAESDALDAAGVQAGEKNQALLKRIQENYEHIEMFGKIFGAKSGKVAAEFALAQVKYAIDGGKDIIENVKKNEPALEGEEELRKFLYAKGGKLVEELEKAKEKIEEKKKEGAKKEKEKPAAATTTGEQAANPNTLLPEAQKMQQAIEQILQRDIQGNDLDIALNLRQELGSTLPPEFINQFKPLVDRLTDATSPEDRKRILQEIIKRSMNLTGRDITQLAVAGDLRDLATEELKKLQAQQAAGPEQQDIPIEIGQALHNFVSNPEFDEVNRGRILDVIKELIKPGISDKRQQKLLRDALIIAKNMESQFRNKGVQAGFAQQLQVMINEAVRIATEKTEAPPEEEKDKKPITGSDIIDRLKGVIDQYRLRATLTKPEDIERTLGEARRLYAEAYVAAQGINFSPEETEVMQKLYDQIIMVRQEQEERNNETSNAKQPIFDSVSSLEDTANTVWILESVNKLDPADSVKGVSLSFKVVANSPTVANDVQAKVNEFLTKQGLTDRFTTFVDSYGTGGVTVRISPKKTTT